MGAWLDLTCIPETYFFNLHLAIVKGLLFDPKVKATCFLTNKTIMTAGSCQIESTSKHLSNGRLKCFTFFISSNWQPWHSLCLGLLSRYTFLRLNTFSHTQDWWLGLCLIELCVPRKTGFIMILVMGSLVSDFTHTDLSAPFWRNTWRVNVPNENSLNIFPLFLRRLNLL